MDAIKNLIRGNAIFKKYHYPDLEEEINDLILNGQKPEILFISCCDSRITPDIMMGTKPGDLFVLRNIGNFVPPYGENKSYHGVASAIEYAVSVLNVKNIIVCAHSHCGACKSLYEDIPDTKYFKNIKKWLELGAEAKKLSLEKTYKNKNDLYENTEKNSLLFQVKNLLTYPAIKEKYYKKEIKLHAWYLHIKSAQIEYYDYKKKCFKDIEEYY